MSSALAKLAAEHASEMMDDKELYDLAMNAIGSARGDTLNAVEIGAFIGKTTVFAIAALNQAGIRANWIVVDPFDLFTATHNNPQGVSKEFLTRIRGAGIQDQVTPIVATSERALPLIPSTLDFVFIDGYHSYEVCKFDLENYGTRVRKGGGLFVDDYGPAYPGVVRACDEFFKQHSRFSPAREWYVNARSA